MHKSIISMLEEIRTEVMRRHAKMIDFKNTWITDISPMAYDVIRKNTTRGMSCSIIWNGDVGFQVAEGEWSHVVNLSKRTCSCRAWRLKGIPCPHGIAAIHHKGLDPLNFVEHWYHKDTYIQAYSEFIQPMPNLKLIPQGANPPIEPPPLKPLPGRPKKNRRKPVDELKKFGKASRKGVEVTCSYCKEKNHNKTSCKKRKVDEANKTGGDNVVASCSSTMQKRPGGTSSSNTASKKSKLLGSSSSQIPNTKARNLGSAKFKSSTGYGVCINEKTGATMLQGGNAANNVVIRPATAQLKSSAVVTGDLGFTPTTRKWKGKEIMTQGDLLQSKAEKQSEARIIARLHRETLSQQLPPTEAQKKRAADNKERAERLLTARNKAPARVTRSKSGFNSSSQPNPTTPWKF